ncbi:DNA adenine methylase [Candidatus Kaiserbacteria bacterium]|nr:DNA adenine methylase [Candidatus Kaiserbacteria bacterium]
MKVTRPALRYYGGGWTRAKWTVSHFPQHDSYVEPCFGAGSILARKPLAMLESVNDVDGRVVNFFTVLRERPHELLEQINLSPWAEDELKNCLPLAYDPLEDARRFFMACWMNIHGNPMPGRAPSFRHQESIAGRYATPASDALGRDDLLAFAIRIKNAQIFNRDAIEIIKKFYQEDCLIYFDPPYMTETRRNKRGYAHEVTPAWHRLAAYWLRQAKGYVVVAGYRSRLYERIYEVYGWQRVEREQKTNGKTTATECLWLSPNTQAALRREAAPLLEATEYDLPLFAGI